MGTKSNRKLTMQEAEQIRNEYKIAQGRVTYLDIARRFNVSEGTIARIIRGVTYGGKPAEVYMDPFSPEAMRKRGLELLRIQEETRVMGPVPMAGVQKTPEELEWARFRAGTGGATPAGGARFLESSTADTVPTYNPARQSTARRYFSIMHAWPTDYMPSPEDLKWSFASDSEKQLESGGEPT